MPVKWINRRNDGYCHMCGRLFRRSPDGRVASAYQIGFTGARAFGNFYACFRCQDLMDHSRMDRMALSQTRLSWKRYSEVDARYAMDELRTERAVAILSGMDLIWL